jgi:hypothetical protein
MREAGFLEDLAQPCFTSLCSYAEANLLDSEFGVHAADDAAPTLWIRTLRTNAHRRSATSG